MRKGLSLPLLLAAVAASAVAAGCRPHEPSTDAERLARGREIVRRMSDTIGAAGTFSVTTAEKRDEATPNGTVQHVTLTRETTIRRPDRLYSKVSGDRTNEVFYDGVGITLVMHNDKIYGQARAPETLDKMLDAINERYGLSTPVADFAYSSPAKALLSDSTTGGWVGRETVNGEEMDHLAFKDRGVSWEAWIPATGDPLPRRAAAEFTDNRRLRKIEMSFERWNLNAQTPGDRFTPKVPADYEGVAILQRARILREMPHDDASPAAPPEAKAPDGKN